MPESPDYSPESPALALLPELMNALGLERSEGMAELEGLIVAELENSEEGVFSQTLSRLSVEYSEFFEPAQKAIEESRVAERITAGRLLANALLFKAAGRPNDAANELEGAADVLWNASGMEDLAVMAKKIKGL